MSFKTGGPFEAYATVVCGYHLGDKQNAIWGQNATLEDISPVGPENACNEVRPGGFPAREYHDNERYRLIWFTKEAVKVKP
ncbi:MAG: hypothetical protein KGJ23_07715 [Euryarchaeota archaeon]|nr:hypothetical protein [Euryarchaeota archaeon]MDE1836486.1 hypothetical protein [Euryarchaeota archaeon]MDE1880249.1 hypothetical protein [Euryarchaeota archaeon]MDE2044692.1 hypothetical protein [Thermoplasmata archaeon]